MGPRWPAHTFRTVPPRQAARSLALQVRRSAIGNSSGWCDLTRLCIAGGFRTILSDFSDDERPTHSALLIPRIDGTFDIVVDPQPRVQSTRSTPFPQAAIPTQAHRFRFRVAHEIGHSFFYNRTARPPSRLLPFSPAEEKFCDEFASALLVPPHDVRAYPADTTSVFDIHQEFQVSVQAAAHSLAHAYPEVSIIGLLHYRHVRTNREGDRVIWSHGPAFIPKEARLSSHAVDEARTGCRVATVETLSLGALQGVYRVIAHKLPGRSLTIVVAARV